jgi:hypothetical protein
MTNPKESLTQSFTPAHTPHADTLPPHVLAWLAGQVCRGATPPARSERKPKNSRTSRDDDPPWVRPVQDGRWWDDAALDEDGRPMQPLPELVNRGQYGQRPVEWLWEGMIPLRKVTLLVGDPEKGKTFVALDLAARVTRGDVNGINRGGTGGVQYEWVRGKGLSDEEIAAMPRPPGIYVRRPEAGDQRPEIRNASLLLPGL